MSIQLSFDDTIRQKKYLQFEVIVYMIKTKCIRNCKMLIIKEGLSYEI